MPPHSTEADEAYRLRFGPRHYTDEQAAMIEDTVRAREPLREPPVALDDDPSEP